MHPGASGLLKPKNRSFGERAPRCPVMALTFYNYSRLLGT